MVANTGFNAPCEPPREKVKGLLTGFTHLVYSAKILPLPTIYLCSDYSTKICCVIVTKKVIVRDLCENFKVTKHFNNP